MAQAPGANVANDASVVPRRLTEQFRTRMLHAADGLDGIRVDVTGPWRRTSTVRTTPGRSRSSRWP